VGIFNDSKHTKTYEDMLKFLQARIKFVEKLFEDNKFEFVFSYMAQMAPSMIVYEFCNRESIPFFRPHHSRIKDLRIVYDNIYEYSDIVWERANEILANKSASESFDQATKFIQDVQNGDDLYYTNRNRASSTVLDKLYHAAEIFWWEKGGITTQYYYDTPKIKYLQKRFKKSMGKNC